MNNERVPAPSAAVRARGLSVSRGGRQVLRGIDFTIPYGSVTGLLGPSGCGKTTLMRAIVGAQARVSGELAVLGAEAGSAPLRDRIGYLTQSPSVYADLTARQNLEYFAAIVGVPRAERQGAVRQALADVDLTSSADALTARLSGGQRTRVSLAVALLGTPELLVLDEPTVGLDPVLRRDLWGLFHRLTTQRGVTLLVSSHVMDEADRCDRLILMRHGRILAADSPAGLQRQTRTGSAEAAFLRLVETARPGSHAANHANGPQHPPHPPQEV